MSEAIRWTIKVSKETDLSLRTFLGAQGMKKGDLSNFVEDAVRWRIFDRRRRRSKTATRIFPRGTSKRKSTGPYARCARRAGAAR